MKKIFTFAFALVCAIAVNAQTITLSSSKKAIEPVVITAGDKATAYVYGTGVAAFTAFEANLFLPEGIEITKAKAADLCLDEEGDPIHTCSYANKGAEGWKLLCYTDKLTKFNADEGAMMQLTLTAGAAFKGGDAQIKGIILTDPKTTVADSEVITIAEATGINDVKAIDVNAPKYNFQGVQVKDAKMFIQNGKKYIK